MSKTETITRIPKVGERVEVYREDEGDAGLKMIVGTQAVITKVEYNEGYDDYTIAVDILGNFGREDACHGGWEILAEYGKNFSDYYDGKTTLQAFWSVFQVANSRDKARHMRWAKVHGDKGSPEWSAPFRQGRYTFDTYDECLQAIADMKANSSEDTLRQLFGDDLDNMRPALFEVYSADNHDPCGLITDTIGMEL
jgi:hypothetical protein